MNFTLNDIKLLEQSSHIKMLRTKPDANLNKLLKSWKRTKNQN